MPDLLVSPIVMASFGCGGSITAMEGTRADYSNSTGVGVPVDDVIYPSPEAEDTQWALDWLSSDAATRYEGRWVALGKDLKVYADGSSPSALKKAVAEQGDLVILYVIPEDVRIVGGGRLVARP